MRVSAGAIKGRKLRSPRGMVLRPTAMQVKEALFNILGDRIKGATLVDFFAGTGNIGIEALSRGADHVVFVENHAPSVKLLKNNLNACGLNHKATVYAMDAFTFLKKIKKRPAAGGPSSGSASDGPGRGGIGGRFSLFPHGPPHTIDILFADPPYHGPLAERFLRHLGKSDMITKRTIVIIEHFHKMPLPEETDGLNLVRRYRYGDTVLSIYKRDSQDKLGGDFATVERV